MVEGADVPDGVFETDSGAPQRLHSYEESLLFVSVMCGYQQCCCYLVVEVGDNVLESLTALSDNPVFDG